MIAELFSSNLERVNELFSAKEFRPQISTVCTVSARFALFLCLVSLGLCE